MKTYKTYIYDGKPSWNEVEKADIDVFQWESENAYRPCSFAKMCFVKNEGIYILLMTEETNPKAVYKNTDDPVYKDSCLEAFLYLGEEGYINIETNANGAYLSALGKDRFSRVPLRKLTKEIPVVTPVRTDDFWGNEIFISNKLLSEIYPSFSSVRSGKFKGNFYKCGDETHTAHYGSFSPMESLELGFHNPQYFADIIVEEDVSMLKEEIIEMCHKFGMDSKITYIEQKKNGLINKTYYLETIDEKKYVLQKINTYVFKNPQELMENISSVTHFLRKRIRESGGDPERETLRFYKSDMDRFYTLDDEGGAWRLYHFVDDSYTVDETKDLDLFRNAGATFGRFMRLLNTYPAAELHETIVDFHNTPARYRNFLESVEKNMSGRMNNCRDEIEFVTSRKADTEYIMNLYENGYIPTRVTHNDSKLNNVLFDINDNSGVCVIDLDTVMPGVSLYDFGDTLRSGANNTREDDSNLDNVFFDLDRFRSYAEGFLSQTADCLTKAEKENLSFGVKLMTFECGIRFLTDYIDGDVYFRTDYPEHNLVRARNQFKLVSDIEAKYDKMQEIIRECLEKAEKNTL